MKSFLTRIHSLVATLRGPRRLVFIGAALVVCISTIGILVQLDTLISREVPRIGGTLREGVIGIPRFANPVLATSETDRDIVALVYAGLMRKENGTYVPDLAARMEIDESGLVYRFTLRTDATFHDGTPVTTEDIRYTVEQVQNPLNKSPYRIGWEGVDMDIIDTHEFTFTLGEPYAGFMEVVTLGILPKHIWQSTTPDTFALSEFNTRPIGSGPYRFVRTKYDSGGLPKEMIFEHVPDALRGTPFIYRIHFVFFADEARRMQAFERGDIDAFASYQNQELERFRDDSFVIHEGLLPRVFGIFFLGRNNEIVNDIRVRQALATALDKEALIAILFSGFGTPLVDVFPPSLPRTDIPFTEQQTDDERLLEAGALLDQAGWRSDATTGLRTKTIGGTATPLAFSLATSNTPEFVRLAEMIQETMGRLGGSVSVDIYDPSILDQDIIRPRQFEALLFGMSIRHDTDVFAFWHSSQRNDPGLNISEYANPRADALLNQVLQTTDDTEREQLYERLVQEMNRDMPFIPLFAPTLAYITREDIQGISFDILTHPHERFSTVHRWYLMTDRVWDL